jgi:hypothetical protein
MSLDDLGLLYDTDKASCSHDYCTVYERFLEGKVIHKVLEIGVHKGGSLRMWRDFFNAEVYGWDVLDECLINEDGIQSFKVDASNPVEILRFFIEHGRDFDLVVDDGSHKWGDQLTAFSTIFPLLKSGAVYILEDLHTSRHFSYKNVDITPLYIFDNLWVWSLIGQYELLNKGYDGASIMMVKK